MNEILNKKLPLGKSKRRDAKEWSWASCLPFVDNKLALLIHRPRFVSTFNTLKYPHIAIHAFCGNHFTGTDKFTFLEALPESGKLLCARCEENAVLMGMPSAEELVGKHVHLGKLKAIRTCCK